MAGKGEAEGCASCAKWCLIIFNVLFCLIGIGLIAAGAFAYIELRDYLNIVGNPMINAPAIVLIAFGCITFIIAAIGCIGACKESACLLFTFAAIIGILLIAEIAAGAAAFAYRGKISDWIDEHSNEFLKQYQSNKTHVGADAWDGIQAKFNCCGVNSYTDWGARIPDSCGDDYTMKKGCKTEIVNILKDNVYIVGAVGIAFGVIELLGIVLACCVGCNVRKGEHA